MKAVMADSDVNGKRGQVDDVSDRILRAVREGQVHAGPRSISAISVIRGFSFA
jgi:hypothetical protein